MSKVPVLKLTWLGEDTVKEIKKFINEVATIKVLLPQNYNHAIFKALNEDISGNRPEDINITGDARLLSKISTISGLEKLDQLAEFLEGYNAVIRITTPPMIIITTEEQ